MAGRFLNRDSQDLLGTVVVYKQALPFDSLEKIQHVVHEIARVAVSDKATVAIPADDAIELGVEIFKFYGLHSYSRHQVFKEYVLFLFAPLGDCFI